MNIRTLQRGLQYRGRVKAPRQLIMCLRRVIIFSCFPFALSKAKRGSGYFNVIDGAAVEYVSHVSVANRSRREGRGDSCASHTADCQPSRRADVLYILVALGQAGFAYRRASKFVSIHRRK